jgi:hypothetical protein
MLPIQASTLDPSSPWGTLIKVHASTIHFIHHSWHTSLSPSSHTFVDVGNGLPRLNPLNTRVIQWNILKDGICLL